ncbi:Ribosomal-protein-alanine acetyltransferase [Nocardioides aquaticus]|uniref:Ribosomal-protein-alanine acetyltransferase n=1 Tax=Nocardioides aquaticus TaxID=160826 RepID=A0ABX8EPN9_9ACTN|nr:GNAT family N-acetyltransferase [Nocardioides aquaticus]QVT80733.1 Ribosomal-protein-alanine acetyltransferase [Nocardioides aquaticus]
MDEPVVRRAAPDDAAAIARVHVRGWQVGYRGLLPDAVLDDLSVAERSVSWRERLAHPVAGGATTCVAVDGDRVLGFCSVGPSRDPDAAPGTAELWALYVDPDRWRHGAGRALDAAAAAQLTRDGVRSATLWVLSSNTRARAFYEHQGWRVDGATRVDRREGPVPLDLAETRYAREVLPS